MIIKCAPAETMNVAPGDIVCIVFNVHWPALAGLIIIFEPVGKVAGGIILSSQLAGSFQLPLPVNV